MTRPADSDKSPLPSRAASGKLSDGTCWNTGIELKPAASGTVSSSLSPETLARSAYSLLFRYGGENLLHRLQEEIGRMTRAARLRRLLTT